MTIESRQYGIDIPNRMYMDVPGMESSEAYIVADTAAELAYQSAPKLSGNSARGITPISGQGFFGVQWADDHVWFQESGIRPFTMSNVAGKVIPMWVDDPYGIEQQRNPRAETRETADGRRQVLIFRRAARQGQRKVVKRRVGGVEQRIEILASYPGAPGRISRREAAPHTAEGKLAGQIAKGNVGVRWRHPGLYGRGFLAESLLRAAAQHGIAPGPLRVASSDARTARLARAKRAG